MKIKAIFFLLFIFLSTGNNGIAQSDKLLKWIVEKKVYFTSHQIIESKKNDTVIFLDSVSFHSKLFTIEGVDKIVYCKKTRKLIIGGSKQQPTIKISEIMTPTILTPITEVSDSYSFDKLEYIIGEHTYYLK